MSKLKKLLADLNAELTNALDVLEKKAGNNLLNALIKRLRNKPVNTDQNRMVISDEVELVRFKIQLVHEINGDSALKKRQNLTPPISPGSNTQSYEAILGLIRLGVGAAVLAACIIPFLLSPFSVAFVSFVFAMPFAIVAAMIAAPLFVLLDDIEDTMEANSLSEFSLESEKYSITQAFNRYADSIEEPDSHNDSHDVINRGTKGFYNNTAQLPHPVFGSSVESDVACTL